MRDARLTRFDALLMVALVGVGLWFLLPDLAHDSEWNFDESFNQAVARHVYEHPFKPMLYPDPVHDTPEMYRDYWSPRIWLVKPVGGYWVTAALMLFVGKVPLAYRLAGLLGHLISALTVYVLGRRYAGRMLAFIAGLGLLALPLAWTFVQARFISDDLDVQLAGWVCGAMLSLFQSIRLRSLKWAALAGAFTGMGILVKFVLALTPLGVAFVLWALALARFCDGPRTREFLMMTFTTCAVALPWNLYAALKWPLAYSQGNLNELLIHLRPGAGSGHNQWARPVDAVFNEMILWLSSPLPQALTILAGVWLLVRAARSRDFVLVGLAAWLWATWLGHSLPATKQMHHLWNSVVPQFIALAMLTRDSLKRVPLAFAALGALATPVLVPKWPWLSVLRTYFPANSQSHGGDLIAGLQLLVLGLLLGFVVHALLFRRLRGAFMWVPGFAAACWFAWVTVHDGVVRQRELRAEAQPQFNAAFSKTVGQAIDALTPEQSVVLFDAGDAPGQIERHNMLFWSNRMVVPGRDPTDYPAHGFHPYLVSAIAEPYEPLPVPASAWLRAYDLTKPLPEPAPVPEGLTRLDVRVGNAEVVGYSSEPSLRGRARYAFIVRPNGDLRPMRVRFTTAEGPVEVMTKATDALKPVGQLARAAWYVLPVVGPSDVQRVDVLP